MNTLFDQLLAQNPRTERTKHTALCERVPIELFDSIEHEIRPVMRARGIRAMYRGPRKHNHTWYNKPSMTRRCDATHVLFYYG